MAIWPTDPPAVDQFEVSLFGPGRGESSVVHLGQGEWVIIDSCVDQRSRLNPALDYLECLGVDIANDVKFVVATHLHDDHIAGIADIYNASQSARLVLPNAVDSDQFCALIEQDYALASMAQSRRRAFKEVIRLLETAAARRQLGGTKPICFAGQQRYLLERSNGGVADIVALSPSDEAFHRAVSRLGALIPQEDTQPRRARIDPNECSIALWIDNGPARGLFGGDVLQGPNLCGWKAIIEFFTPSRKAAVFKVPHHGAPNADDPRVWEQLLTPSPHALIAPFRGSQTARPSTQDVARLRSRTPNVFATAATKAPALPKAARRDALRLSSIARDVRDPWGACGQIRTRQLPDDRWATETFGPARNLVA